jgi:hypothetical protein
MSLLDIRRGVANEGEASHFLLMGEGQPEMLVSHICTSKQILTEFRKDISKLIKIFFEGRRKNGTDEHTKTKGYGLEGFVVVCAIGTNQSLC